MSKVVRLAILLVFGAARVAGAQQDSTPPRRPAPVIRRSEAIALGAGVLLSAALDGSVRTGSQEVRSGTTNDIATVGNAFGNLLYVGPVLAVGWVAGRIGQVPSLADATWKAASAGLVAGSVTGVLKVGFGRVRPRDGGDPDRFRPFTRNASFPSGHTTVAMAVATSLAHATRDSWSDVLLYASAMMTGYARINDDKHWLSDVVVGGAVGFLVGRQLSRRPKHVVPVIGAGVAGVAIAF